MKTLKILSALLLFAILTVTYSCNTNGVTKTRAVSAAEVAVFYTSDNANSALAAAEVGVRYAHTTFFDIDNLTAANILTAIQTIVAGDSVHRVFIVVDTATVWANNKLSGAHYDSLTARLYTVTTNGVVPDAAPEYFTASATKNVGELVWDELCGTAFDPLITEYNGDDAFSVKITRSKKVNTDSTAVDSTGSLTADAYNGDWIQIYAGTGMGQTRQIYDNSTTVYYVSPDWTTNPDQTTLFKIKHETEDDELFYDMYSQYYILSYLSNLNDADVLKNWKRLLDNNGQIGNGNIINPKQDLLYLRNTVLDKGKAVFDYNVSVEDD